MIYSKEKQLPEGLVAKARAAVVQLGAERQAAVRRSYTQVLGQLLDKDSAGTLSEKGGHALEFLLRANAECRTAAELTVYLVLAWMLVQHAKAHGIGTSPAMETAAEMAAGICRFGGLQLKTENA